MASGNITPEQFKQACTNAIKVVQNNIGNILINATNIGSGEIKDRVFREGKTTSGTQMKYKNAPSAYTKLRQKLKRQINHKDLILSGDLFNSMDILTRSNNEVEYGFINNEMAEIAYYQQTSPVQVNQPIFDLSDREINLMEAQFEKDVSRIFTSALQDYPSTPSVPKQKGKQSVKPVKSSKPKKTKSIKPKKKPTKR